MRYYQGTAPCLGCGTSGKERMRESKDSLCRECKKNLEIGSSVREQSGDFALFTLAKHTMNDVQVGNRGDGTFETTGYRAFPYVSDSEEKEGDSKRLLSALRNLLVELDEGHKDRVVQRYWMEDSWSDERYYLRSPVAKAVFDLLREIGGYAREIQQEAHQKGSNLLLSLNQGTITLAELNEQATKRKQ